MEEKKDSGRGGKRKNSESVGRMENVKVVSIGQRGVVT